MFEVGFTEILLIACLALLVLGPERLPKFASQIGRWTGRARSMARQLRSQLEQEVSYEDFLKEQNKTSTAPPATPEPAEAEPVDTSKQPPQP